MPKPASAKPAKSDQSGKPRKPALDYGPLRELIGFQIRVAQLRIYADFLRDSPEPGITPGQTAVLVLIGRNPNLTQQRLSDQIKVEKSTLVVLLHRLAARGLIRRVQSTEDRRHNVLELTAKGDKTIAAMLKHIARHEDRVFAALSKTERKQLLGLLARVNFP